jgi:hypothetical protein
MFKYIQKVTRPPDHFVSTIGTERNPKGNGIDKTSFYETLTDLERAQIVASVHQLDIRPTPNEREQSLGQSYDGRQWDVLFMAFFTARRLGRADRGLFQVSLFEAAPPYRTHRSTLSLWMMIRLGDQGEPVITIGFPQDF